MKINKLLFFFFILFFIVLLKINSDEIIQNDWKRYEIIVDRFSSFIIYLPAYYEIKVGKLNNIGRQNWVLHEIFFNNKRIGGIFLGNFEPDYYLWDIDEKYITNIPILIFNKIYQINIFNNINRTKVEYINSLYVFETCLINYSDNMNEKYFHIFGHTDYEEIKDDLIKSFSTIKKLE